MFGNVNLPNLFPAIKSNFERFTNDVSNILSNTVNGVSDTVSNLVHPDRMSISNDLPRGQQQQNVFSNNTSITQGAPLNKSIIGRNEFIAAEGLKRVTPQQLKDAGQRSKQEFFKMLLPAALEAERKYGVPASVTLAQAALESGWGKAAIGGYNIFGIKGSGSAGTVNVTTREFVNGRYITIKDNFAKYGDFYEAVMKHGKVFQGDYAGYKKGLSTYAKTKNDNAFIDAVGHTYATDPNYAKSIKSIMKDYDLVNMSKNFYIK